MVLGARSERPRGLDSASLRSLLKAVAPVWTAGAISFKSALHSLLVVLPKHNCVHLAQAHLGQDSLAGQQFGGHADHKPQHGQAAIPEFGKGHKAEAGGGVVHGN